MARDKANLDITWLRDESLEDMDNLPAPEIIAREIVEDLTAALRRVRGSGRSPGRNTRSITTVSHLTWIHQACRLAERWLNERTRIECP
ncbi:MAG: hypothetical protein WKF73_22870 [Nocardioidaceae bacterium]